ncbi:MAG: hypothetical protein RSB38_03150 [Oscillospiraceae bacterium]
MIRDTNERVYQVKKRVKQYRQRKERQFICIMTLICFSLTTIIAKSLGSITNSFEGGENSESLSGAMLLHNNVSGYVLLAVVAFSVGVIFTIICVKKAKNDKKQNKDIN